MFSLSSSIMEKGYLVVSLVYIRWLCLCSPTGLDSLASSLYKDCINLSYFSFCFFVQVWKYQVFLSPCRNQFCLALCLHISFWKSAIWVNPPLINYLSTFYELVNSLLSLFWSIQCKQHLMVPEVCSFLSSIFSSLFSVW